MIAWRDGAEKRHPNKVEIKNTKSTNLILKDGGEDRPEEHPIELLPYLKYEESF